MIINHYGEQLIRTFEMKCGKDLMEKSIRLGTYVLENVIEDRFDEAAWCLMTYDIWAIRTVEDWKEAFPDDLFINSNDTYTHDNLITVLKQCIKDIPENNIIAKENTNMKNSIMNNIDNYVMASRILETLDAYLVTNEDVMDTKHIDNVKEQMAVVATYRNEAFASVFKGIKELEKDALRYGDILRKYKNDITDVF